MRIEVWEGKGGYFWHFRSRNGKITADSESFPTKAHAVRAAKAVVRGVICVGCRPAPWFVTSPDPSCNTITRITW